MVKQLFSRMLPLRACWKSSVVFMIDILAIEWRGTGGRESGSIRAGGGREAGGDGAGCESHVRAEEE